MDVGGLEGCGSYYSLHSLHRASSNTCVGKEGAEETITAAREIPAI